MPNEPQSSEVSKHEQGAHATPFALISGDILTVLLTATLLVLPIEDGSFWPVSFVAMVPLLLRMWNRSFWAIYCLGFAAFYLYIFYVLEWIDVYGWYWRVFLVFMNAVAYGAVFPLAFWIQRRYRFHFWALVLPSLLIVLEFKQTLGFLGFPWPLLCHSQAKNLPLIQIASLGGCWLVTFVIVIVNESLAHLMAGGFKPKILPIAVLPLLLIGFSGLYGAITLAHTPPNSDVLVTVAQGSEATNQPWTSQFNVEAIDEYSMLTEREFAKERALTREGQGRKMKRLVIWPETAIPDAVFDYRTMLRIKQLAKTSGATFVVGCLTLDPADGTLFDPQQGLQRRDDYNEYNSLVAFEPDGKIVPMYSKVHLVPFGEVIPLKEYVVKWFPGYPWGSNDIMPGSGFWVTQTGVGKLGAVVCYESFFPQLLRRAALGGAQIMVLGSNTSWFGKTKATYQHADFDVFRAVENGMWFCRAATTGVSSIIDPQGRAWAETAIFQPEALTVPIGLRRGTTLYTLLGDWVPALCAIFVLFLLLGAFVLKEKNGSASNSSS